VSTDKKSLKPRVDYMVLFGENCVPYRMDLDAIVMNMNLEH
jgi:hypothetical protein